MDRARRDGVREHRDRRRRDHIRWDHPGANAGRDRDARARTGSSADRSARRGSARARASRAAGACGCRGEAGRDACTGEAPRAATRRRVRAASSSTTTALRPRPRRLAREGEALARARASYALGNQRLFAGRTDAAVLAYEDSLKADPNYAAGYRGLGLAYTQAGDRTNALKAFMRYVTLAPQARDVTLIKQRIVALSHR